MHRPAPFIHTYPPCPPAPITLHTSIMPTPTPASPPTIFLTSLVLGCSANAIELLVSPAPAIQAATDLKARSFDILADLLVEHSTLSSSA